ncbi:hypothetical protein MSG28_000559 [Choristoneura fumiferana]|uniref:Uncharacterized protein n=1 Tax=Choristoneura fumiferana TaxID=7141 RepID=A0ACC0K160_CHOFU|nr:hypothetical protein MSG28_000559 [Choristoneura fumiferana]
MRVTEAGGALLAGPPTRAPPPDAHLRRMPGPPRNDEGMHSPMANNYQARENTIQVMTAERREYGRAAREPAPPEYFGAPPDHYFPPHAPYDEPWGHPEQSGWAPSDIKELTPGPMGPPNMGPPPGMGPPSHMSPGAPHLMPAPPFAAPYRPHPPHPPHPLERARDDRDRRDRDRDRRDDVNFSLH